jgi:LuxR family maltose regulon positive regulatory protein
VVCAGAGYGKTSAVHDFIDHYNATTDWMQLSERDNVGARFWESFNRSLAQFNTSFANEAAKISFPDTREKQSQFLSLVREYTNMERRILVLDDFHCIEDPSVLRFLEEGVFQVLPPGTSVILISRSTPRINIAGYESKGMLFTISENDLRFTESELAQYFHQQNIFPQPESLRGIMKDTNGWVFAINLIARSYQRAPGYEGYVRNAMKINIFRLMETEVWDGISEPLQNFLIRLSLIEHLSVDLITLLAGKDKKLIAEMQKQNAYIHRDSYINAYLIHHLFLEFLTTKQELL